MKAQTLLVHVCLWYARVFVLWLLFRIGVQALHSVPGQTFLLFSIRAFPVDGRVFCYSILALGLVWLICLWNLRKSSARLFLRLTAGLFLLGTLVQFFRQASYLRHADPAMMPAILPGLLVVFILSVLGFAAMLWLSWFPPQRTMVLRATPLPQPS